MWILQVRLLEWVAMPASIGSSQPRDWIRVSLSADGSCLLKSRHHFADKGPSSQSYSFSSSRVWMWELDYKEDWVSKNWCFWTMVLEKTLEILLDCKEIQPVHPKGNRSWMFIGGTNSEASILWPPNVKSQLIRKDADAGKDWRQEEKGMTEDKMAGWHQWLNGQEFEQALGDGEGQRGLECCSPWGQKKLDMTKWLNNYWYWESLWDIQGFPGGASGKRTCLPMQEMEEMWVWSLSREEPLEEGLATHASILARRTPGFLENPSGLQSIGLQRVRHDWSNLAHMHILDIR